MVMSVAAARTQIAAQIVDGVDNSITPSKLRQVLLDAVDALAYAAQLETYRMRGSWSAASGSFPSETPLLGNVWTVSTAGTVDGVAFDAGDQLLAIVDAASSTTYDGNWLKIDSQVTAAEIAAALGYTPAPIASPTFTGTPAAPTPAAGDSSTKIATTAFVAGSYMPAVLVDSFSGTDDQKIAAANTYAKTLSVPSRIIFPARDMSITSRATLDPPDHSVIDMRGCRITSSSTNSIRIGSASRNTLGYQVLGANVARASVDASGGSSGIEIRNVCGAFVQIAWVRDHTYGILFTADQPNGGISYSQFSLGIIHDNTYSMHFSASAPNGYINENIFYGGSFNHSSAYPTGVAAIHLNIPDGVPANNNKFIGPSFEDGQSTTYVQAMLFGSLAVANSVYHPRWENGVDQYGHAIRFRPGSEMNQIIGVGNFLDPANMLDESGGRNCWQTAGGDYIARRVSASSGAMQTFFSWWEDAAKVFSFENLSGVEKGWVKTNGAARFTDLQLEPSSSVTPAANGDLVIEKTSNTKLTFKLKGDDAAVRSGSVALGASTTVGRLARYTDTAGAQAETTGLFEDASGNVGAGTATPNLLGAGKALTVSNGTTGDNLAHIEAQGSRSSADSTFATLDFWHQSTRVAAVFAVRGSAADQGYLSLYTKDAGALAAKVIVETGGVMRPAADNTQSLGTGSYRWSTVYAGTALINTSDATKKTVRGPLTEAEIAAWGSVEWVIYQFNDAIAEKGADGARLHSGLVAQQVRDAFAAQGLDAHRYGLFCEDDEFITVETGEIDNGIPVTVQQKTGRKVLGLRYTECLAFEAAYVRSLLARRA